MRRAGGIVAAGEFRPSALQAGVADVGMVVSAAERGRGLATAILKLLVRRAAELGLRAICSTEATNPAAQKAIERAGFTADHRLLDVRFSG